jgi:malate dehydrogenase (oxaloacetate-decarboxylating)(NADP+)
LHAPPPLPATPTPTHPTPHLTRFGRDYIIPKPFDERLLPEVAAAVVRAAIETGVARLADINLAEYKRDLVDLSHKLSL